MYTYIYIYIERDVCMHVRMYMCVCMCVWLCVGTDVCLHVCICVCGCVCVLCVGPSWPDGQRLPWSVACWLSFTFGAPSERLDNGPLQRPCIVRRQGIRSSFAGQASFSVLPVVESRIGRAGCGVGWAGKRVAVRCHVYMLSRRVWVWIKSVAGRVCVLGCLIPAIGGVVD